MKKLVLSTIIAAAGASIALAFKQGKLKPATDKMKPVADKVMDIPLVAKTIDRVQAMRQAANDGLAAADDQAPGDGGSIGPAAQASDDQSIEREKAEAA